MKIVVISDTHTKHKRLTIPECDVLVHCGDFTWDGKFWDVWRFVHWLEKQPARHKVVIAGNHDLTLDHNGSKYNPRTRGLLSKCMDNSIHYLEDSGIEIDGIKFYGTPWTPWFYDWGFNGIIDANLAFYRGVSLTERYSLIPEDVQVLICHGPPYDILDKTLCRDQDDRRGSVEMRKLTSEKLTQLGLYLCGHIHEARGMEMADGGVTFINASTLDRSYEIVRPPMVIHLDENGWVQNVEDF